MRLCFLLAQEPALDDDPTFGRSMNLEGEDWFDTWRLRAVAASVSAELQQRFGTNEFYSPEEVLTACDTRNVFGHSRGCALAMFVESGKLARDPDRLRDIRSR